VKQKCREKENGRRRKGERRKRRGIRIHSLLSSYPMIYRAPRATRGGRRARLRGLHREFVGDSSGAVRALAHPEVAFEGSAGSTPGARQPAGDPHATWPLLAMGLHGPPSRGPAITDLGVDFDARGATWPATHPRDVGAPALCSSPATWRAKSLIVWAIARARSASGRRRTGHMAAH